jgi:hypothetical protein
MDNLKFGHKITKINKKLFLLGFEFEFSRNLFKTKLFILMAPLIYVFNIHVRMKLWKAIVNIIGACMKGKTVALVVMVFSFLILLYKYIGVKWESCMHLKLKREFWSVEIKAMQLKYYTPIHLWNIWCSFGPKGQNVSLFGCLIVYIIKWWRFLYLFIL